MIIYINSDGGSIVFNDSIYEIKKGVLCFISSGCYHYTMPEKTETYKRNKLFFSDDVVKRLSGFFEDRDTIERFMGASVIYAQIPESLQSEVDSLFLPAVGNAAEYSDFFYASSLLRLIAYIDMYAIKSKPLPFGFLAKTMSYINEHICENITIDSICGEVHMSKYHFCRKFKEITGLTVMDYVMKTRITLARNMLAKENMTVGEVSEACGFSSISHFCRVFKQSEGQSPLQYRRSNS